MHRYQTNQLSSLCFVPIHVHEHHRQFCSVGYKKVPDSVLGSSKRRRRVVRLFTTFVPTRVNFFSLDVDECTFQIDPPLWKPNPNCSSEKACINLPDGQGFTCCGPDREVDKLTGKCARMLRSDQPDEIHQNPLFRSFVQNPTHKNVDFSILETPWNVLLLIWLISCLWR